MKHLGDITKIHGCIVPVTDVVIGGSPCQDLSVAGKRAGLAGKRSGLFMEQIRIIKEMRYADGLSGKSNQLIRPRYMVWENVPGAFSSNHGEDFRAVLEETIRIAEPDAPDVPLPDKGKWPMADCWYGDGWSVAYRVFDAQFWGVPQRRRRIALVADFGGHTAPEILFERNGLCWDFAEGRETGERTAGDSKGGASETVQDNCLTPWDVQSRRIFEVSGKWPALYGGEGGGHGYACYPQISDTLTRRNDGSPNPDKHQGAAIVAFAQNQRNEVRDLNDKSGSLAAEPGMKQQTFVAQPTVTWYQNGSGECFIGDKAKTVQTNSNASGRGMQMLLQPQCYGFKLGNSEQARSIGLQAERSPTLNAECGGNKPSVCYDARGNGDGTTAPTMTGDHQRRVSDYTALVMAHGQENAEILKDMSPTLNCDHEQPIMCYPEPANTLLAKGNLSFRSDQDTLIAAVDCRNMNENVDVNGTLQAKPSGGQSLNLNNVVRTGYAVRRLTPLECERLQGYPDGWTDIGAWTDTTGKLHKESSDSARYKALGNSISLPNWKWVLKRLCACYERDATMASLFDGIGGFPLIWEQLNGKGSCLWASEIEEFPIAVTKRRFAKEEL